MTVRCGLLGISVYQQVYQQLLGGIEGSVELRSAATEVLVRRCDEVCRVCVGNSGVVLLGHQLDLRIRGAVKEGSSSGRCSDDA